MPRRLTRRQRFQWRVATVLFAVGAVYGFASGDPLVGGVALAFAVFGLAWVRVSGSGEPR